MQGGKGTFFPDTINLLAFTCIVYEWASQRHLPLSFFFFICLRITIRNGGKRWHLKWAREGIWNFRHFEHFAAKYETECKWVLHMSKRKRTLVVLHDEEKSRNWDSFQEWSTSYSLEFVISFGHKRGTLPRGLFSFSWRCYDNNNGLFKAHNLRFSKLVTLSSNLKKSSFSLADDRHT